MPQKKLSLTHFIFLCEQLSDFLKSGVSLYKSLQILSSANAQPFHPQVKTMLAQLESGIPFVVALQDLLPPDVPLHFSHVGAVPNVTTLLDELVLYFREKQGYVHHLQQQLAYPMFLLGSMAIVGVLMFGWMMPLYGQFFQSMNLPLPLFLRIMLGLQAWFSRYGLFLVIGSAGLGGWMWPRLRQQAMAFFFPFQSADVLWLLGVFLKGGFSLKQSLDLIQFPPQHLLFERYQTFRTLCLETGEFGTSFAEGFALQDLDLALLHHSDKTGQLTAWLFKISGRMRAAHRDKRAKHIAVLQPCVLVLIAGMVGASLYITLSPVLTLVNGLN